MTSYRDLEVWRLGRRAVVIVYNLTKCLPATEQFGLCSQMQRAVVSIPSNIAEGYGRNNRKEFRHFLRIAAGSRAELETQIDLCRDLDFLSAEQVAPLVELLDTLRRKLHNLYESLQ